MRYERGYIASGKDRQHAVDGQPYGDDGSNVVWPSTWDGYGMVKTWYAWPRTELPIYPPIGWPSE